jgi:carbon monoxide dehydrogenase subunit G
MALNMTGEYELPLARDTVWRALNDEDMLRRCIPGCESLTKLSDTEFQAAVKLAIGPVKARFKGKVTLTDLDPPNGYKIVGEGDGGVAGFAKGDAVVTLSEVSGGTKLVYRADAQVGGKIAQIGQRLIAGSAKKIADKFFSNFAEALTPAKT